MLLHQRQRQGAGLQYRIVEIANVEAIAQRGPHRLACRIQHRVAQLIGERLPRNVARIADSFRAGHGFGHDGMLAHIVTRPFGRPKHLNLSRVDEESDSQKSDHSTPYDTLLEDGILYSLTRPAPGGSGV